MSYQHGQEPVIQWVAEPGTQCGSMVLFSEFQRQEEFFKVTSLLEMVLKRHCSPLLVIGTKTLKISDRTIVLIQKGKCFGTVQYAFDDGLYYQKNLTPVPFSRMSSGEYIDLLP